jgi:hypothetical protein
MSIRKNGDINSDNSTNKERKMIPVGEETNLNQGIISNLENVKLNKSKIGLPPTELLEVGGITEWLQLRSEQLLELSDENKMHTGISQLLGLGVTVAGFALTGGALAPIAGMAAGLGLIGYGLSVADSAARVNKILPIPFSSFTLQRLALSTSADARIEANFDSENSIKSDKLAFLPSVIGKELEMISDYQLLVIELLNTVPEGKRFNVYCSLRQIMIDVGFEGNEEKIAITMNKVKDIAKVDSSLNQEKMEQFRNMIKEIEVPLELEASIESIDKLTYTLPLDKVRQQSLLETSKHSDVDLIDSLVENLGNTVICSPGGGGKGIVISNALRAIKKKYPDIHIFYIDPKGDEKEKGYFEGCVDSYKSFKSLGVEPEKCVRKYEQYWNEFYAIEGRKLLVLDEATTMGNKYDIAGKSKILKGKIADLPSLGGSQWIKSYIICQNPHVSELGINTGILAQYARLAILTTNDGTGSAAFDMMMRTKFTANIKYVWDDVKVLCDASPRNRAFFYSKFDEWLPMPELTNYSGYDRDTNTTFTNNHDTVIQSEQLTVIQDEKQQIKLIIDELKKSDSDDLVEAIKSKQTDLSLEEIEAIKGKMINTAVMTMDNDFLTKFKIMGN